MISTRALAAVSRARVPGLRGVASATSILRLSVRASPGQSTIINANVRALHSNAVRQAQQVDQSLQPSSPQVSQTDTQIIVEWGDGRKSRL